ncbi:MAG: bifunctional glutamate N-acetyltransferase/amino-acid acetyltransferase ArgJ [Actinomycetota bacterium]
MSVTYAKGFRAAGVTAGFKESARPDLGLLVCDGPAAAAGAFTTNALPAAPVTVTRSHLDNGTARAVVVNSGQANAGTGEAGLADAAAMCGVVGRALGIEAGEVLVCSTGVIGPRVALDRFDAGVASAIETLSETGGNRFAEAICTTDTRIKAATTDAGPYRVGGCAKGVGMIAPRLAPHGLATLLAYLTTDAPVPPALLTEIVERWIVPGWNSLVLDGCQSTNDTVLVLSSGAAGGDPLRTMEDARAAGLADALATVSEDLARQLAADAEGATKQITVQVDGAVDVETARRVGLAVAGSDLLKAAVFGGDPNPGRILQAAGDAGVALDPVSFGACYDSTPVIRDGVVLDAPEAKDALQGPEVLIRVTLGDGDGFATVFGSDLTYDYVRINAEYST